MTELPLSQARRSHGTKSSGSTRVSRARKARRVHQRSRQRSGAAVCSGGHSGRRGEAEGVRSVSSAELGALVMKSADVIDCLAVYMTLQMLSRIPQSYAPLLSDDKLGRSDRRSRRLGDDHGRQGEGKRRPSLWKCTPGPLPSHWTGTRPPRSTSIRSRRPLLFGSLRALSTAAPTTSTHWSHHLPYLLSTNSLCAVHHPRNLRVRPAPPPKPSLPSLPPPRRPALLRRLAQLYTLPLPLPSSSRPWAPRLLG